MRDISGFIPCHFEFSLFYLAGFCVRTSSHSLTLFLTNAISIFHSTIPGKGSSRSLKVCLVNTQSRCGQQNKWKAEARLSALPGTRLEQPLKVLNEITALKWALKLQKKNCLQIFLVLQLISTNFTANSRLIYVYKYISISSRHYNGFLNY